MMVGQGSIFAMVFTFLLLAQTLQRSSESQGSDHH
jgi:hypothetical protein